jgi:hypothetical protein
LLIRWNRLFVIELLLISAHSPVKQALLFHSFLFEGWYVKDRLTAASSIVAIDDLNRPF